MYGKDIGEIIEKYNRFYAGEGTSLVQIRGIGECESRIPSKPLNAWNFDTELEDYLDLRVKRTIDYWKNREGIDDMMIPSVTAWYGIAEHTAWLGGAVDFSEDTSYNHQILDELDDMDKLKIDPDNIWFKRVAGGIEYIRNKWGDQIYTKLRGADAPSDIANIARGNELFYDVYDDPDAVMKLADFCADGMKYYFKRQQEASGMLNGGYLTGFDIWMPGNSVGQISEDASCMMSPSMYSDIFLDALKKSVDGYDHVMMHTHSLGQVHLPTFAGVDNINIIEISNDPNSDRAIDVWRKYKDTLKDKIVIVAPTFDELKNNLDLVSDYRNIIWYYARTKEEANEVIDMLKPFGIK